MCNFMFRIPGWLVELSNKETKEQTRNRFEKQYGQPELFLGNNDDIQTEGSDVEQAGHRATQFCFWQFELRQNSKTPGFLDLPTGLWV